MTERDRNEDPDGFVDRVRPVCLALPDVVEEAAWVGTRWTVRKKNFAHVVHIDDGWPAAYARAAATDGPATVLTFRADGPDLDALREAGPPFFKPVWFDDIVGMILDAGTDWDEVGETDHRQLLPPGASGSPRAGPTARPRVTEAAVDRGPRPGYRPDREKCW